MSSGRKVKGLLRGLRYISQIFESEKEEEIQIGNPTDVKHVAHIGWDGPTVNSPSWMNDFKTSPGFASAPLNLTGNVQSRENDNGVKWVSEDSNSSKRSSRRGQGRNLTELPKGSRRPSSGSNMDSPIKEISSDKPRQSRRSSRPKDSSDGPIRPTRLHITDSPSAQGDERSPGKAQQEIPKTTRRKKSKDSGPSKSRSKAQSPDPNFDLESPTSMSITNNR